MTTERSDHTTKSVDPWALELGRLLREARENRKWSLADAQRASTLDIKRMTIGSYERGDRMPSTRRIAELAELYEVPVQSLIPAPRSSTESAKEEA